MNARVPAVALVWIVAPALAAFAESPPARPAEAPAGTPATAVRPADAPAETAVSGFRYGPILATDPEVRTRIKKLYRDQGDLETVTQARLAELSSAMQSEADGEVRFRLAQDMVRTKQDLELHSMELGLQIAQLNGDAVRVAEYEKALDRLRHPENYRPALLDPSIAQDRARQLGYEK